MYIIRSIFHHPYRGFTLILFLFLAGLTQANDEIGKDKKHDIYQSAIKIISPDQKEKVDKLPVTVEVDFKSHIEAKSFRARLNHKDVTERFSLSNKGAVAKLDIDDGINTYTSRHDGFAKNFLIVEARIRDKQKNHHHGGKHVSAKRQFFVKNVTSASRVVTIRGFYDDLNTPAQAGAIVFINGELVGTLDSAGQYQTTLPAGQTYSIRVVEVGLVAGNEEVILTTESPAEVDISIVMASEGALLEESQMEVDGISNNILASDFSSLTLRFVKPDDSAVVIAGFSYIDLVSLKNDDNKIDVSNYFSVKADGSLVLTNVDAFRSAVMSLPVGGIRLRVETANDGVGLLYAGETDFYIGRYSVGGSLAAPPSNTSLPISSIEVRATSLATDIVLTTVSDANGAFSFGPLPIGNWEFSATTQSNGLTYSSAAPIIVERNKTLTLNLLTTIDIINNVPPYSVQNALLLVPQEVMMDKAVNNERLSKETTLLGKSVISALDAQGLQALDETTSITVTAGAQDFPVSRFGTLTVPMGTERVYLNYQVYTAEYPTYVLAQSIFNDVWRALVLTSTGQQLFSIVRQVNSQLYSPPVWQSNGSTGMLTEEFDVSALAASGDIELTLFASTTNIGDSLLATTVNAQLGFQPTFRIRSVTPDNVTPTNGDSSYYSIPYSGQVNTFARTYTLDLLRPQGSTITNVTADLVRSSGTLLDSLVDEAPGGTLVREIDDQTLEVTVTMTATNSSAVGSPPPVHNIMHGFKVTAQLDDGTTVDDTKDSSPRHALWHMPDGVPRFGYRDPGGDDWSAKGTYEWIVSNNALFTRTMINDISGEHARNIDHSTHTRGTDIDIYHFVNLLSGAVNGSANYLAYRNMVVTALGGDQAALQTVTNWISTHRDELDDLTTMATVAEVITPNGAASGNLQDGWAMILMTTGQLTDTAGHSIDTGLGAWTNGDVRYRNDHNDHIHIDLTDTALNNAP